MKTKLEDCLVTSEQMEARLKEHDARMNAAFQLDENNKWLTINISYPYEIELKRIPSYAALLQWSLHLAGKSWMDLDYLREFIEIVCHVKGWNIYQKTY